MDANRFNAHGIECVGLATGYGANHTYNEYIVVEDLIRSGEMVEQIIPNTLIKINESGVKQSSNKIDRRDTNNGFVRFINSVEKAGNKLPHPFFLFVYLMIIVLLLSKMMSGVSVTYTAAARGGGEMEEVTVAVKNLLDAEYMRTTLKGLVATYTGFAPLGLVMVMMLAIGFAQDTGLFHAFMKKTMLGAPPIAITFILALTGVCANIASNAGIVFGATIGAALFASLGEILFLAL